MDPFCEDDLFDEDVPFAPSPGVEQDTDQLTVPTDDDSRRLNGRHLKWFAVFALAALVALLVSGYISHATGGLAGQHPSLTTKKHRHPARRVRASARRRVAAHHQAGEADAPPVGPSRVIVTAPSSGAERPTRDENVGSGRPNSPSSVGKTEQFAYLGE
jgi:hypothetical protein